ncbi:MAG: dihydroorotase, partial [Pseudomonadota bacterium]
MTKLTFLNARLVDPEKDDIVVGGLVVEDGRITKHLPRDAPRLTSGRVIDCDLKYLAPGIVDLGVKVCEPGDRHKESYGSAGQAAAAGGVTTMITRPDTDPAIDSPETLEFVTRRANEAAPVNVLPMAALT